MLANSVSDFYTQQSSTYDKIEGCSYWEKLYLEYNKLVQNHLHSKKPRTLDLGCGTGLTTSLLMQTRNEAVGLDLTWRLLKTAQGKYNTHHFSPINAEITHIPFQDKSFERIICLNTLEHIEDIEQALAEIARICEKGGEFLFDIPSSSIFDVSYFLGHYGKNGLVSALQGMYKNKVMFEWESHDDNFEPIKVKTYRYNPRFFEKLVSSYGFEIVGKRGVHISTMIIPEKIQANSFSPFLSVINKKLEKIDDRLNSFSFFKNHALYILYECRMREND
ncbi:class I SAM-dependent methyltransferase [Nitrosotalea sinensis]|uniref:class I SAM-dependent methyltransferase n=1 Tax=Nitrosotalea sinensis TaxID=1499975 RepID=UPI0013FDBD8F|nr:class I SAM-dependent methyltransferase [Candidatus Nitrosotalea sinensis]